MEKQIAHQWGRFVIDTSEQQLRMDTNKESWSRSSSLNPTLSSLFNKKPEVVPLPVISMKAKQFNDGLYAAVELLAQDGTSRFAGKKMLLGRLRAALRGDKSACDFISAAGAFTNIVDVESLSADAMQMKFDFESTAIKSKPLGFYTWSDRLESIFKQDRFLMQALKQPQADALLAALTASPELQAAYLQYLQLIARLSNRLYSQSLAERLLQSQQYNPGAEETLFPYVGTNEQDVVNSGKHTGSDEFDLMDEMIRRIKDGTLDLKPKSSSGWYEYCQYALEPLVVPERTPEWKKVQCNADYRELMQSMFKAFYALTRETHVKAAAIGAYGSGVPVKIYISPTIRVEPWPTVYLRRAESYRFIRNVLEQAFGEQALNAANRLTAQGPVAVPLLEELVWMERLMFGAYLVACDDLSLARFDAHAGSPADIDAETCVRTFETFAANMHTDCDLVQNAIMMVPVYTDMSTNLIKVWAFLGWRSGSVTASYARPPKLVSREIDANVIMTYKNTCGPDGPPIAFSSKTFSSAAPVMRELWVDKLLNRDELRQLCADCNYNEQQIIAMLDPQRDKTKDHLMQGNAVLTTYKRNE